MLKGKRLVQYTNVLSPNKYKKNDKIILKYFQLESKYVKIMKIYCNVCSKYKKSKL